MNSDKVLNIFRSTGALLEGHFQLSSGRHSATYFQCAQVLQYPQYLTMLAGEIVSGYKGGKLDAVVSPAIGGIVIGTEVGRQFGVRTIFTEREEGIMSLRRGFEIKEGERILIVEDVLTTGGSVREVLELVHSRGGVVEGVSVVVDRSGGKVRLHKNQSAVLYHEAVSYPADGIPDELASIPVQKPGSRGNS